MSLIPDDGIVVTDGSVTRRARFYGWLLDHVAKFPGRVAAVTFLAGAVVTAVVIAFDGNANMTTIISLGATLWALFFAVMIYLLTARDTDKVLDQIADLHEQLVTALAAPEEESGDLVRDETPADESLTAPVGQTDAPAREVMRNDGSVNPSESTRDDSTAPVHTERPRRHRAEVDDERMRGQQQGRQSRAQRGPNAHDASRLLVGVPAIVDGVPSELLDAWTSATGKKRDQLSRAWTRDPRSDRQWVVETEERQLWLVFSKGDRGFGVMSLDGGKNRMRRPVTS